MYSMHSKCMSISITKCYSNIQNFQKQEFCICSSDRCADIVHSVFSLLPERKWNNFTFMLEIYSMTKLTKWRLIDINAQKNMIFENIWVISF